MPSWYCFQIHITTPMTPNGILLIGTWVSTQPINIPINPTKPMNNIKVIFLQDKCPLGQLFYESI